MQAEEVRRHYEEHLNEIDSRLEQFEQLRDAEDRRLFQELVFVILTSQSSATDCWDAAEKLDELGLLEDGSRDEMAEVLADHGIQYEKNKADYIVENREELSQPTLKEPSAGLKLRSRVDPEDLDSTREQLVNELKGIGWKGASHFLRNIGYGNGFAIVSSRITSKLSELGVIDTAVPPSTRNEYLEMEEKIREFSRDLSIDIKALDLVLWSMETGEVFK